MNSFYKKTFAAIFIAIFLFLVTPNVTLAWGASFEVNPFVWIYNILTAASTKISAGADVTTAGAATAQIGQTFFEWAFTMATETLKRQLLNMIVDQTVNWIQGGGDPKFVTNWPGFFRDAIDQAGGKFINNFALKKGANLCSPFKPLLGAAFIPIPTFETRTSCTLTQMGINLDNFLKDFKSGGWVAWQEMVLKPQNNVYGAYALAWDQYEIEKSAAAKAAEAEAQASKGFLSAKKCVQWNSEGLQACVDSGESYEACKKAACVKEEIITPGAVVGDAAAELVGVDIKSIVSAKDLKAYVGAITNAILNRMFAEGVGLLHTAVSGSAGGNGGTGGGGTGGSSTAQVQCSQLLGTAGHNDCIAAIQGGADMKEFQKNYLISLIDQDLAYQNQLLGAKQATLTVLNQSIDTLNQLKNCQASSSPGTLSQTQTAINQVQGIASTTVNQITKVQSDIIALQVKQREIKAITNVAQIASLWAQVSKMVSPSTTSSLVTAAQDETSQKQQSWGVYEQQLASCQQQQQQQQQQQLIGP